MGAIMKGGKGVQKESRADLTRLLYDPFALQISKLKVEDPPNQDTLKEASISWYTCAERKG